MKMDFCFVKNSQSNPYSKAFRNAERIKVLNIHELSSLWYLGKTSPLIFTFTAVFVSHFYIISRQFKYWYFNIPFCCLFLPLCTLKCIARRILERNKRMFIIFSLPQSVTGENTNRWIFFLFKCLWSRAFCLR